MRLSDCQPPEGEPLTCRLCGSAQLRSLLDLGATPPCELFLTATAAQAPEATYPLHVRVCEQCLLAQLPPLIKPMTVGCRSSAARLDPDVGAAGRVRRRAVGKVRKVLAAEEAAGLHTAAGHDGFAEAFSRVRDELVSFLIDARRAGKTVVGYGAPGKGNTLLNYCGTGSDLLAYTVDRNPYKHGRFTPGTRIPSPCPRSELPAIGPIYVLILPWNLRMSSWRSSATFASGMESWCSPSHGWKLSDRSRSGPGSGRALQRVVADLALLRPAGAARLQPRSRHPRQPDPSWAAWVQRWHDTSTLTPKVRALVRTQMAKAGRWLAAEHTEITEPGQWTRSTCAAWVAAIDRMTVGDYTQRRDHLNRRAGAPIAPRTKAHILTASRAFFRDCQEWEWIGRHFDPTRALALPRSVAALIGTDPRIIADDVWAKLIWAGLQLQAQDLPGTSADSYYPLPLIRALALTWLFSGLRSDEISRLRVGCIRWQQDGHPIAGDSTDVLAQDAVCLLDVPVHKTGTAFTKPVDPLVGQAIQAWQALRPEQPTRPDRKTGEQVDLLFSIRAHPVAKNYINRSLIPALCAKAGVPTTDVRGNITSHRARSTIASQLYNAKEPMTLFELQAWLGHRTPSSTQHYAKINPNTLSKAYNEAGYFARNIRTIEVLIDRDAVTAGAPDNGQPWQHYDLGHGWCSYSFFEQCQHRMACARCDFYTPKGSTKAQLLKPRTTCSGCSPPSRSPTTNARPSTTGTMPWTPCWPGSPTSRHPPGPPRSRSASRRP